MSVCDTCAYYPCSDNRKKVWGSCPAYMLKSTPVKTMYDRIVSKSPEEMACFIQEAEVNATISGDRSYREILGWLKSPVKDG